MPDYSKLHKLINPDGSYNMNSDEVRAELESLMTAEIEVRQTGSKTPLLTTKARIIFNKTARTVKVDTEDKNRITYFQVQMPYADTFAFDFKPSHFIKIISCPTNPEFETYTMTVFDPKGETTGKLVRTIVCEIDLNER